MMVSVGFLSGLVTKGCGIGHEHVLHIVRLAVFVQHRSLRIAPHARGAEFVNDHAAVRDPVRMAAVRLGVC